MHDDEGRRSFLRLVALLSAYVATGGTVSAADTESYIRRVPKSITGPVPAESLYGAQNDYALFGSSNFKAVYDNPRLKEAFFPFLVNIFTLYQEDRMHETISEVTAAAQFDRDIYQRAQVKLWSLVPLLFAIASTLPALWRQKSEMSRQTLQLLAGSKQINGMLEVDSQGRYVSRLRSSINLRGDIVLLQASPPSYWPEDVIERERFHKLGRYVPLNEYAPISPTDVPDHSLDLVASFVGLHHAPPENKDRFVASLHRVLRPGGRLILRDHDVDSPDMNRIVALAHDVFNMGMDVDWQTNQHEIRNFTSLARLVPYIESMGFKKTGPDLLQNGDPTRNTLMEFVRV